MRFLALAAAVATGVYLALRVRGETSPEIVIGTKRVMVPAMHDASSAWKKDYPRRTNQFGSAPYGASGQYLGFYLDANDTSTIH